MTKEEIIETLDNAIVILESAKETYETLQEYSFGLATATDQPEDQILLREIEAEKAEIETMQGKLIEVRDLL